MSIGEYAVAIGFAVVIITIMTGFNFSLIWNIAKMALRVLLVLPFAIIGLLFFSLFGSVVIAVAGLAAGVIAGATAPTWWRSFHWKGRLISAGIVAGVLLLLCGVYLTPYLL